MLIDMDLPNVVRENTPYEGVYRYIAPGGYEFWCNSTNFGNEVWGMEKLTNKYSLKQINNIVT